MTVSKNKIPGNRSTNDEAMYTTTSDEDKGRVKEPKIKMVLGGVVQRQSDYFTPL